MAEGRLTGIDLGFHIPLVAHVIVPGDKIQVSCVVVIIQLVETKTHQVVSDKLLSGVPADNVDLHFLISPVGVGHEALVIQVQTGIVGTGYLEGRRDLGPVCVDVAPKNSAPFFIELIKVAVALFQPIMESLSADFTVAVSSELIIDLPADHSAVILKMFGHLLYDPFSVLVIERVVGTVLSTQTIGQPDPIFVDDKKVFLLSHQPGSWSRGGST